MPSRSAVPDHIHRHFEAFRQERRMRAGSLIVSVFGDAILPRGGCIWLGSLIRLLQPLGVSERLVRTSVFRLVKEHWLSAETRGRRADYRLTANGRQRFEEASRRIYASWAPRWDRHWRFVFLVGELAAAERERLRRALVWEGFGGLGNDCFVHPGADLDAVFDVLAAEGLAACFAQLMPLVATEAVAGRAAGAADLVRRAWDLGGLAAAYADFVAAYRPIVAELRAGAAVSEEEAFLLRILLIHDYRRLLLRDPDLPEGLLPADWPGQQARQLCRELYRCLLPPSERHLDRCLRLADGTLPAAGAALATRFPEEAVGG